MDSNPLASFGGFCFLIIILAAGLPLNIIFLEVAREYEDDPCLDKTDGAVNIVTWMKVRCWVNFGILAALTGCFILGGITSCCCDIVGYVFYGLGIVLVLPPLVFQIVWNIWGLCVLYYSPACHMHAPALFAWFIALLALAL